MKERTSADITLNTSHLYFDVVCNEVFGDGYICPDKVPLVKGESVTVYSFVNQGGIVVDGELHKDSFKADEDCDVYIYNSINTKVTYGRSRHINVPITAESRYCKQLMGEEYINLKYYSDESYHIGIGAYIEDEIFGKFYAIEEQMPSYDSNTGGFVYDLKFHAFYHLWGNKAFNLTTELKSEKKTIRKEMTWYLTNTLREQMREFLKNLQVLGYIDKRYDFYTETQNEIGSVDRFVSIHEEVTTQNQSLTMAYNGTSLLDALKQIADAWQCEYWVEGNEKDFKIHFGKCSHGEAEELSLETNVEKMDLNRDTTESARKLFYYGGTQNIPNTYRKGLFLKTKKIIDANIGSVPIMNDQEYNNATFCAYKEIGGKNTDLDLSLIGNKKVTLAFYDFAVSNNIEARPSNTKNIISIFDADKPELAWYKKRAVIDTRLYITVDIQKVGDVTSEIKQFSIYNSQDLADFKTWFAEYSSQNWKMIKYHICAAKVKSEYNGVEWIDKDYEDVPLTMEEWWSLLSLAQDNAWGEYGYIHSATYVTPCFSFTVDNNLTVFFDKKADTGGVDRLSYYNAKYGLSDIDAMTVEVIDRLAQYPLSGFVKKYTADDIFWNPLMNGNIKLDVKSNDGTWSNDHPFVAMNNLIEEYDEIRFMATSTTEKKNPKDFWDEYIFSLKNNDAVVPPIVAIDGRYYFDYESNGTTIEMTIGEDGNLYSEWLETKDLKPLKDYLDDGTPIEDYWNVERLENPVSKEVVFVRADSDTYLTYLPKINIMETGAHTFNFDSLSVITLGNPEVDKKDNLLAYQNTKVSPDFTFYKHVNAYYNACTDIYVDSLDDGATVRYGDYNVRAKVNIPPTEDVEYTNVRVTLSFFIGITSVGKDILTEYSDELQNYTDIHTIIHMGEKEVIVEKSSSSAELVFGIEGREGKLGTSTFWETVFHKRRGYTPFLRMNAKLEYLDGMTPQKFSDPGIKALEPTIELYADGTDPNADYNAFHFYIRGNKQYLTGTVVEGIDYGGKHFNNWFIRIEHEELMGGTIKENAEFQLITNDDYKVPIKFYQNIYDNPASLLSIGDMRLQLPIYNELTSQYMPTDMAAEMYDMQYYIVYDDMAYINGFIIPKQYVGREDSIELKEVCVANDNCYPMALMLVAPQDDALGKGIFNEDKIWQMEVEGEKRSDSPTFPWTQYHINLVNAETLKDLEFDNDYILQNSDPLQIRFLVPEDVKDLLPEDEYEDIYMEMKKNCRLAGMKFEVEFRKKWNHNSIEHHDDFAIVRNEDFGAKLPNEILRPANYDPCVLENWNVKTLGAQGFIEAAEYRLLREAFDYYKALQDGNFTFTCEMMSDFLFGNGEYEDYTIPTLGQKVSIKHKSLRSGQKDTRIIGIELKLDKPYDTPKLTCGETEAFSRLKQLEKSITKLSK